MAYQARLLSIKSCTSYWDEQFAMSALGIPGFADPDSDGVCVTSDVLEGIRFAADNGAKAINLSLGGLRPAPAYQDALNYAVSHGAFAAVAMGNEFEEGNPTEYPAAYAPGIGGVMSVGAVGRSLRRAYYSNTGTHLEISAPGGDDRDGGLAGVIFQTGLFGLDFDPGDGDHSAVRPLHRHAERRHVDVHAARHWSRGTAFLTGHHQSGGDRSGDQTLRARPRASGHRHAIRRRPDRSAVDAARPRAGALTRRARRELTACSCR